MEVEIIDQTGYEPKILMFACNWCSYAGLDLAGTSRVKYPVNVTVMKTMCSGRVEPSFVMKALSNGVDGVIISMCHPGDCHYIDGNYKAIRRFHILQDMLESFGIEKERVRMDKISASEANLARDVISEMVETLRELGPIKISEVNT
ncbi:MAG: hydrogenase iron-sulfur subunit [Candidatus Kariarchaeaceae archaeon]|jgi:F420-non-reducing hydrogenase iron-sulfur subunit